MPLGQRDLEEMAAIMIRNARDSRAVSVTREVIAECVREVVETFGSNETNSESIVDNLESRFSFLIGRAFSLDDNSDHEPWLDQRIDAISWSYWKRYWTYLSSKGWGEVARDSLHNTTQDILARLEDPGREGTWDRRGLIVGHIQSGKTANYIGLICKAVDAGYKLIIILAGIHNSLRSQTQIRLDEGFLGYDSVGNTTTNGRTPVGVGLVDSVSPLPGTITTRDESGDFNRRVANHFNIYPGGDPLLFVVKKNGSVLRNLLRWVISAADTRTENERRIVSNVPLLLIDDEADYGSVDTANMVVDEQGIPDEDHSPRTINKRVRQILYTFDKSAYVGYTATPFANIFIHDQAKTRTEGQDLFPRSFIISLPSPSNYVGPSQCFPRTEAQKQLHLDQEQSFVRYVTDHAVSSSLNEQVGWIPPKHDSRHVPLFNSEPQIPPSLRKALLSFILVCSARLARGHSAAHNSMLVHVTRFVNVQQQVYNQLNQELLNLKAQIHFGDPNTDKPVLVELEQLWNDDFQNRQVTDGDPSHSVLSWEEVRQHITRSATSMAVKLINGTTTDILEYSEDRFTTTIAIGGDKLSRGLTLEGLSVSYFLRATRMYDTLMQMGRWFGYRPGYSDLCRLFTTSDIAEWILHISDAEEELRSEFAYMNSINATPKDFGLKVKSHSTLLVTSAVKMRSGVTLQFDTSATAKQTLRFHLDRDTRQHNLDAAHQLIDSIVADNSEVDHANRLLWHDVSATTIKQFLSEYKSHPSDQHLRMSLLVDYINAQLEHSALTTWTLYVPNGTGIEYQGFLPHEIKLPRRSWRRNLSKEQSLSDGYFRIGAILSEDDEFIDLSPEERDEALEKSRERLQDQSIEKPHGRDVRAVRPSTRGLLILYLLDPQSIGTEATDENGLLPIIGFTLSFPGDEDARSVPYTVNNVYLDNQLNEE